jgi:DNA repair exonuclease SbcCD ATPase subunit
MANPRRLLLISHRVLRTLIAYWRYRVRRDHAELRFSSGRDDYVGRSGERQRFGASRLREVKMPEKYRINPVWTLLVAAIAVAGTILISYKMLQTQRRVEAAQTELQRTNARASELEEHAARLSFEREEAVRQRIDIQDKLDVANREISELQSKLDQSTSAIEGLRSQAVTAQIEIDDKQSRLGVLQSEIESLKQTLDKANAKVKNASAERDELQTKFDQAH